MMNHISPYVAHIQPDHYVLAGEQTSAMQQHNVYCSVQIRGHVQIKRLWQKRILYVYGLLLSLPCFCKNSTGDDFLCN